MNMQSTFALDPSFISEKWHFDMLTQGYTDMKHIFTRILIFALWVIGKPSCHQRPNFHQRRNGNSVMVSHIWEYYAAFKNVRWGCPVILQKYGMNCRLLEGYTRNISLNLYLEEDWSWEKIENFHFSFWSFLYDFFFCHKYFICLTYLKCAKRKPTEKSDHIRIAHLCGILKVKNIYILLRTIMFY